jgi:hypothetical protein
MYLLQTFISCCHFYIFSFSKTQFIFAHPDRLKMDTKQKGPKEYTITLEISNVSPQDAGSYRVTAKNALGESNATIGLNFDGT